MELLEVVGVVHLRGLDTILQRGVGQAVAGSWDKMVAVLALLIVRV